MNNMKAVFVTTVAAGAFAALAIQPALARHDHSMARSLDDVRSIRVDARLCPATVTSILNDNGYLASNNSGRADAVLELDVDTNGALFDQETMEEGRYRARLIGEDNRVLFTTSGSQESINLGWLCEDIGEEIVDDLEERLS